jgi:hypothetical protein
MTEDQRAIFGISSELDWDSTTQPITREPVKNK